MPAFIPNLTFDQENVVIQFQKHTSNNNNNTIKHSCYAHKQVKNC